MKYLMIIFLLGISPQFTNKNANVELITNDEYHYNSTIEYTMINHTQNTVYEYTISLMFFSKEDNDWREFGKDLTYPDKMVSELITLLPNTTLTRRHQIKKILKERKYAEGSYKLRVEYNIPNSKAYQLLYSKTFKIIVDK